MVLCPPVRNRAEDQVLYRRKGESEEAAEKMLQKLSEALQGFAG